MAMRSEMLRAQLRGILKVLVGLSGLAILVGDAGS